MGKSNKIAVEAIFTGQNGEKWLHATSAAFYFEGMSRFMSEAQSSADGRPGLDWKDRALLAPRRAQNRAEREVEKLSTRIRSAIERGDTRTADYLRGALLRSTSGKIAAVQKASQKRRRRLNNPGVFASVLQPVAPASETRASRRPRALVELAFTLDMRQAPNEEVVVYPKPKGLSDFRPIHRFGMVNHARQLLFNRALEPFLALDGDRPLRTR
jgi:hypothetical protein